MVKNNSDDVVEAVNAVIQVLSKLDDEARIRVLDSASTLFGYGASSARGEPVISPSATNQPTARPTFSDARAPSPKEFLFQKQPKTDMERIACLAFYLTHFRDMPHFKTLDLGKLNTEAAQIKFSNTAYAAENATKAGYLTTAAKGQKQITSWGEQFVAALPDRDAALKAISQVRQRKSAWHKK